MAIEQDKTTIMSWLFGQLRGATFWSNWRKDNPLRSAFGYTVCVGDVLATTMLHTQCKIIGFLT